MTIVLQNTVKSGFFVISGRSSRRSEPEPGNSGENDEKFDYFMQNKANFRKSQMNVSIYLQTAYENKSNWTLGENKPNSNPIKPNFQKAQMSTNVFITKDYRRNDAFAVQKNKPNSTPISVKPKMNANAFSQKDYENETAFRPQKNKPNQTQFQMPTNPSKEREEKRVSGTFSGSQLPERIYYCCLWEIPV